MKTKPAPEPKPVAFMWHYVGNDPVVKRYPPCARSIHEMDPENPPYPDMWKPVEPLYATPQQAAPTPTTDAQADRQYRNGFWAGWNAGVAGNEKLLAAVGNRAFSVPPKLPAKEQLGSIALVATLRDWSGRFTGRQYTAMAEAAMYIEALTASLAATEAALDAAIAQPAAPLRFDEWQAHPYTVAMQKSIKEDYVPRDPEDRMKWLEAQREAQPSIAILEKRLQFYPALVEKLEGQIAELKARLAQQAAPEQATPEQNALTETLVAFLKADTPIAQQREDSDVAAKESK